jgi:predicted neuraminidase
VRRSNLFPVTIALSEDEGKSWPYMRNIETGDNFCGEKNQYLNRKYEYPWIHQSKEGFLHIVFSYGNRQAIKHVIVTEDWVMGNNDEGGAS